MVSRQHFKRDGHSVGPSVGTKSVPDGTMDGIVDYVKACQSHKGHGPAAQLWRQLPLRRTHLLQAAVSAAYNYNRECQLYCYHQDDKSLPRFCLNKQKKHFIQLLNTTSPALLSIQITGHKAELVVNNIKLLRQI